ncbi:MAG: response regulator transcription factor [Chloroflexi bacterium]|nr:response regulator transcription factor [Chloroflexota bacterium]
MIRVLISSPVRLIADLMGAVLENQSDILVEGYVTSVDKTRQRQSQCDIILVSAALPNEEMDRLLRLVTDRKNAPRVIVFGAPQAQPILLHYIELGAAGCVSSEDSVDKLLETIRAAATQSVVLSPQLTAMVVSRVANLAEKCRQSDAKEQPSEETTLTSRERQVLQLIAQGYRNHEIAERLTIELGTTKNHVHNILNKLQVTKRSDAVAYWSLQLDEA